ncbi:MAG: hypothetical protein ACE141_05410 [Bryobacteraceae bacterium]
MPSPHASLRRVSTYLLTAGLFLALAVIHISLIVYLDNTNLATTNGLWKATGVRAWEYATAQPFDSGGLLYMPAYGYLCRLIPDRAVSYGEHGEIVTYRKMAMLNAFFSALASSAVFLLALRFTGSVLAAVVVALAHASAGFVLLHGLNSEDVTPAYAFFVLSVLFFFGFVHTRSLSRLLLCAVFLVLTTLFHWTLMIPALAALVSAQIALVVSRRHRAWFLAAFPLVFVGMLWIFALSLPFLVPYLDYSLWKLLYPPKAAAPSGWLGFRLEKLAYALVGIGNYFLGASQFHFKDLFQSPQLERSAISWLYALITVGTCTAALFSRRASGNLKLLAGFCLVVFGVGELEHLYSQPQDPQSQIQPMFVSVVGLIIIMNHLRGRLSLREFRVAAACVILVSLTIGVWNVSLLAVGRGADSRAVATVKQLERIFAPGEVVVVSHGYEVWNTWWYIEAHRANRDDYLGGSIHVASPFSNHAGMSTTAAAEWVKERVADAFASGRRVVACSLWVQEKAEFAALMSTVLDGAGAGAYYDALRGAFPTGRTWDTPVGQFVELLPAGGSYLGDAGGR